MGGICCTKYDADGQSALILDKNKKEKPQKPNRKKKGIQSKTDTNLDEDKEDGF